MFGNTNQYLSVCLSTCLSIYQSMCKFLFRPKVLLLSSANWIDPAPGLGPLDSGAMVATHWCGNAIVLTVLVGLKGGPFTMPAATGALGFPWPQAFLGAAQQGRIWRNMGKSLINKRRMHTYMIILSYISNLSVSGVAPLNQVCFHQEWWLSSQSCLITGGDTAKKNCTWDDSGNTSCHPLLGVRQRPIIQSARVLLPLFLKASHLPW